MQLIRKIILTLSFAAISISVTYAQPDQTASIHFVPAKQPTQEGGRVRDFAHVEISGIIDLNSPQKLAVALEEARRKTSTRSLGGKPLFLVFLDSPGGNVQAAIAMGRLLRANAADVWVDREQICASACILVLAGGTDRWAVPEARLGIHRPFFDQKLFANLTYGQSQKKYALLSKGVRDYLAEMGIADELYNAMMRVPSQDMRFIDQGLAEETNLLGKDPAHEEWERARAIKNQGIDSIQRLDQYVSCINAGEIERKCAKLLSSNRTHN